VFPGRLAAAAVFLISSFNLRVFTLMHECGHGSLSRTRRLNRGFGFLLGHRGDAATRLVATL
jgi:omega-6 fatty acid desaturase (delta-12 desaturase)